MDRDAKRRLVEALIQASPEPISAQRLADIVPRAKPGVIAELVTELNAEYEKSERAFEIWEVAGGYQMRTRPDFASYVQQMYAQRPARLSRAALETLAIVAYRQPVTRAEIEHVRGVDVGPILRGLVDRKLVRIAGHREVPGRPMLYATTRRFLEVFGLPSLRDLPTLRDLEELMGEEGEGAPGSDALSAIGGPEAGAVVEDPGEDDGAGAFEDESDEGLETAPPGGLH